MTSPHHLHIPHLHAPHPHLNLHAPHPHFPHPHLPHPHLPHPHLGPPGTPSAGAYVGRIGTLAVAMGVGTAAGTGFCAACAYADAGGSTSVSAGPSAPTTSQPATVSSTATAAKNPAAGTARGATSRQPATATAQTISTAIPGGLLATGDAATGTAPAVPTDAAIAGLLAAARRERIQPASVSYKSGSSITTTATSPQTSVEGEALALSPAGGGKVITDGTASAGSALVLTSSATATATVVVPDSTALVIRAKATLSSGSPTMTVSLDGVPITTVVVSSTSWATYTMTGVIPGGSHVLSVSSSNSNARRSLYIDTLSVTAGSFVEDFQGNAGSLPDSANWTIKTGTGWDPGVENYQTANVGLDGQGNLVLKATRSKSSYASGWVETKNKISFGYGTITARIKVPSGQGLWPAFWLKGANEDTVPWPQSGEIDVLELPSTTTTIYSTLHGPITGSTGTQQAQVVSTVPDLSAGYHNFWVRHLPNQITFGVDDRTLGTLTPASLSPGSQWVYNQPMFAILNLAVGGSWAGAPNASTVFPAALTVDWVRWDPP